MNKNKLTDKELERLMMKDLYNELKHKGTPLTECGGIYLSDGLILESNGNLYDESEN
jgi:hypothetical protein